MSRIFGVLPEQVMKDLNTVASYYPKHRGAALKLLVENFRQGGITQGPDGDISRSFLRKQKTMWQRRVRSGTNITTEALKAALSTTPRDQRRPLGRRLQRK